MSDQTTTPEGEPGKVAEPATAPNAGGDQTQSATVGVSGKATGPSADSASTGAPEDDEAGHGNTESLEAVAIPEAAVTGAGSAAAQAPAVAAEPAPVAEAAALAEPAPAPEVVPVEGPALAAEATPASGEDFAAMLETSEVAEHSQATKVGDKVSGVIVRLGEEYCFVDFGGRSEGLIAITELKDEKGEVNYSPGDPLEAFVVAEGEEIRLSRIMEGGDGESDVLYQAYKSGVPIKGTITAANKWGVGVDVCGMRAFCPISQLDTTFIQDAEEYRGKTLEFRILRFRDRGRNIVLSRRALLEVERDKEADGLRERIVKGAHLEGKVTRLENFGAFVELGAGVEGLVHVSELKHERVEHPKEVLEKGAQVKVVVLAVKNLGNRRKERISLSIKALEKDPWDEIRGQYKPGTVTEGTVQAIEDFGAFIELAPTVRGMVHVSEMADRRIPHPREVVSVGDRVKVVVMEVDTKRKRLRLSMRRAEQVEDQANLKEFHERQRQERADEPSGGAMQDALKRAQLIE